MGSGSSAIVGPAVTAAMLLAFAVLDRAGVRIENPALLFLIGVAFTGYVGGLRPALLSAALALVFSLFYFSIPASPLTYTGSDQVRVVSIVLGTLAVAILTGLLRERLGRAERDAVRDREARIASDAGTSERRRVFDLLERVPASVAITRGPDHIIEIANARFRAGTGGDPVGKALRDAFPNIEVGAAIDGLDRAFVGRETVTVDELLVPYEFEGKADAAYLNAVFAPIGGPGPMEGVLVFAANVTESVRARERLQALLVEQGAERARLQMILDQLPEGVTISDEGGTFSLRNRAAEQLFPWPDRSLDTVLTQAEYLHPDGTPYPPDMLPGARARRGESVRGEELLVRVREPFREVPILMNSVALRADDGRLLGTPSVFQEISEIKALERERAKQHMQLRDSETKLRATIGVALDALISMGSDGLITEWNASAEEIFGWRRQDVLGREMADTIIPTRYRDAHRNGLKRYLDTGRGPVLGRRIEIEALHRDGHEFPIELAISAIETEDGRSFTAFVRDISARRRLEATQAAALVEAQHALRLRDEFLAAAAHDLKTPLTAVKGHVQLIRRRLADAVPANIVSSMDHVERSTGRMNSLINELLDVARLQAGHTLSLDRREIDLNVVVHRVVDAVTRDTQSNAIRVVTSPAPIIGRWDSERIERAVTNVVSNSLKYSPDGGEIVIAAAQVADHGRAFAVVTVRDHGIGIPEVDLPRVFTRFHRGGNTKSIEGTGIGLEAARRMIELHDGSIDLASTEGIGTTVTIRLPLD